MSATPTSASRVRYALAQRFAAACPLTLADSIVVCGSTARGWSDAHSDIELTFWGDELPPPEVRTAWMMEAIGVRDLVIQPIAHWDGSEWIAGEVQTEQGGIIPVEFGWQRYADLDAAISRLHSGQVVDRSFTFLADMLIHAVPLRDTPALSSRLARLSEYPDAVQTAVITAALRHFSPDHALGLRRLAARGETLALNERLNADLDAALCLIYAAHRRWMPNRKWMMSVARGFAPGDWLIRCDAALCVVDAHDRVEVVLALVREAAALAPGAEALIEMLA
jgi:hypothetical protein